MTDKEKILYYLKYKGISKNKFYLKTGLSVGFLDSGNSLGVDKLRIIYDNYHDLNLEWIITGEGPMIKNEEQSDTLSLTSEPQVQYARQNNEIEYLKKIIENQQKIIDKQLNTIEAYEKGKIINVSDADARAPKKGVG